MLDLITTSPDDKLVARAIFGADAPLVAERLVRLVPDPQATVPPLLAHIVALDEQVVDVLLFQGGLDRMLAQYGGSCARRRDSGRTRRSPRPSVISCSRPPAGPSGTVIRCACISAVAVARHGRPRRRPWPANCTYRC